MDMEKVLKIQIAGHKTIRVSPPVTVREIFEKSRFQSSLPLIAAKVNNRLVSMNFIVKFSCCLEPVTYNSKEGASIYRRSLCHLLTQAILELYPGSRPKIGQSIYNGYHYKLVNGPRITRGLLTRIAVRMKEIIEEDREFQFLRFPVEYAEQFFRNEGFPDVSDLLQFYPADRVSVCRCGNYTSLAMGPFLPSTGHITAFELLPIGGGFVLRFPSPRDPFRLPRLRTGERKLFNIYREKQRWNAILGMEKVSDLNQAIVSGKISETIKVAEGFHEKKIANIADRICGKKSVRVVLIAGPSSSGKTTFAKRLMIQLIANGKRPVPISIDDYFVNREETPRDENGDYDFESLKAVNVNLLNEQILKLLHGEQVRLPSFDFKTGRRRDDVHPLKLDPDQLIILEGIHGLNEELTAAIDRKIKYKIYISALTQICLDYANRIFTSDTRLLRRIVRDYKFRGYSASETLSRWPSVRRGESRNIFPFQEDADIMFNSALVYEKSVLKVFARKLLNMIRPGDPNYAEARRLYEFLDYFVPVFPDEIPPTSILREFIGGSTFHY